MLYPFHFRLWDSRQTFRQGLPILMYHKIQCPSARDKIKFLNVPPAYFYTQVRELSEAGYTSVSLSELPSNGLLHPQQIVITFDDGYRTILTNGLPVLQKYRFKSIAFLVSGCLGQTNVWDRGPGFHEDRLMSQTEVREWLAAGQEIGAHTVSHPHLSRLPIARAREEITRCKAELEDLFARPIEHFAYPYGDYSPAIRDLVMNAGFKTACTTRPGINTPKSCLLDLNRFTARRPSLKPMERITHWRRRFKLMLHPDE
jgi:peptidoglycan/xylan/chitin deacetylase (PgdA/CDA1 family)